jgi:phosphatidylinositol alpha-1,6-mannosyltransferase
LREKPEVLLIASNFPPVRGGSAIVYHNLAKSANGAISVIAPKLSYLDGLPLIGWREHDKTASYEVRRVNLLRTLIDTSKRSLLGRISFRLTDLAIRIRTMAAIVTSVRAKSIPSICIGELVAGGWIVHVLKRLSGLRVIVYVHGEEITTSEGYDVDARKRQGALLAADGIVVVSAFTKHAVKALAGPKCPPIALIHNGVDLALFRPLGKDPQLLDRYRLGDAFVFVTVCRLVQKKGVDMALRAFQRILAEHPDTRFLIVGSGDYEQALKTMAAELDIATSVRFAGEVAEDELVAHYCLGDVFVMPNRRLPNGDTEGFGLVFLEANACGLPVIAGRDGGSPDAVQDGQNGLVVNGASVDEIEKAMRALRQNAGLRQKLKDRGLEMSQSEGWNRKASAFLEFCADPQDQREENVGF